jgi:hypothetical protein
MRSNKLIESKYKALFVTNIILKIEIEEDKTKFMISIYNLIEKK